MTGLQVLVVDDESLARGRLLHLLGELRALADPPLADVREAAGAAGALAALLQQSADVVLLDIRMPGTDGLTFAQQLARLPDAPSVVFVTAHGEHAVRAFELDAADYLTKPVRLDRLQAALRKVARRRPMGRTQAHPDPHAQAEPAPHRAARPWQDETDFLHIVERGQIHRLPLSQVLCVRAELKYLTVHTATQSYLHDESLQALEERFGHRLLRVHRSTLVSREAMRRLERRAGEPADAEGESWVLHLAGWPEPVAVSRRQLAHVRDAMRER